MPAGHAEVHPTGWHSAWPISGILPALHDAAATSMQSPRSSGANPSPHGFTAPGGGVASPDDEPSLLLAHEKENEAATTTARRTSFRRYCAIRRPPELWHAAADAPGSAGARMEALTAVECGRSGRIARVVYPNGEARSQITGSRASQTAATTR
jgi:hypothetical protein